MPTVDPQQSAIRTEAADLGQLVAAVVEMAAVPGVPVALRAAVLLELGRMSAKAQRMGDRLGPYQGLTHDR